MKLVLFVLLSWPMLVAGAERAPAACPPGEPIQWIADYCMASIGTDDEIAASDCIARENKAASRDACAAKRHFKQALCDVLVKAGTRTGTVEACVADPQFRGPSVEHGGVGGP